MQAIILAAGMGKRLNQLTKHNTKCMVEINGVRLIERMLKQVVSKGISKIIIVVGYQKENLIEFVKNLHIKSQIIFIENPSYEDTNNIYSLSLASQYLEAEESIILESDIIFEDSVLDYVIQDEGTNIALIDNYKSWMTGMGVLKNKNDEIVSFVKESDIDYSNIEKCYKTVGIYKFTPHFSREFYIPFLNAYINTFGKTGRYEQVLRVLAMTDRCHISARLIKEKHWYEINDIQDIDLASTLFSENEEQITNEMLGRWGGYWRYPDYLDYFYLVTSYYPPDNMINEIKAHFSDLLLQYPSSMKVNSLLAAKEFSIKQSNIVIGNGAAELIKALMECLDGVTGFIRPTFEEYFNRYDKEASVCLTINTDSFSYKASDVISFFEKNKVDNLVIINPDNPSGNYICKNDMIRIAEWCDKKDINMVVDESFVDFVDEQEPTLIQQHIIDRFPRLYIIKSISKSYGVPGLRLGVLASGDGILIEKIKKDVAIWNINSFAEFYMQIAGKYHDDYISALEKLRIERRRFEADLNSVEGIRVIPSQANYIMIEILDGIKADELKVRMLIDKKIFIKSLSKKIEGDKQYIRVSIRNESDDRLFVAAFQDVLYNMKKELKRGKSE